MKRRKERELALQLLYALDFNPGPGSDQIQYLSDEQREYATKFTLRLVEECNQRREELDDQIKQHLINWDFNRVAIIDRILLRMAMAEFIYFQDIPPEVTLNEMIEISKLYSTERSGKFINGVLDAMLKKLREDGRMVKTGRGLISKIK